MPRWTFPIDVTLEDDQGVAGEAFRVVADQRDLVRWERHPQGGAIDDPTKAVRMVRFLAWAVAQRTGLTDDVERVFDKKLIEAAEVPEAPEGGRCPECGSELEGGSAASTDPTP